jgi:DNA-binding NarL/FixJ family response regulator
MALGTIDDPIGVFLLDDHEVVRRGVRDLLEAEEGIEVVGEAGTAAEALARVPATRPDVAVLDVRLPDGNGVEVCREIRSRLPELRTRDNVGRVQIQDEQVRLPVIIDIPDSNRIRT